MLGQRADSVAALAVRPEPKGRPFVRRLHSSSQRSDRHRAPDNPCTGCRLVGRVYLGRLVRGRNSIAGGSAVQSNGNLS